MVATARTYTADEWLDLPDDDRRTELVDGTVVPLPTRTLDQDRVRQRLERLLQRAEAASYGERFGLGVATILDAAGARRNARTPELLFVRRERLGLTEGRALEGPPDLVIEIVTPEHAVDLLPGGRKFADYERFGVPFYWLTDPARRRIACYTLQDGRYGAPLLLGPGGLLRSPLFPGLDMPVDEVFASVKQPVVPALGASPFAPPGRRTDRQSSSRR